MPMRKVDVHPQNLVERTFAILVLIFGLVLFSSHAQFTECPELLLCERELFMIDAYSRMIHGCQVIRQFNHGFNDSAPEYAGPA